MAKLSWNKRSCRVIAQNYLTASKRYDQHMNPNSHIKGTTKNYMIGTNDKKYYDFFSGCGANILNLQNVFTLPHVDEVVLAEMVVERFPVDKVKIFKTGSQSCEAAIRIARGYTKKDTILSFGYHGSHEAFVAVTPPAVGCINNKKLINFENLETLINYIQNLDDCLITDDTQNFYEYRNDVAGVIIEPIQLEDSPAVKLQLTTLSEICTRKNIILIFDEMITNCRTPDYCIANYYGIKPDLMCLGKAIANGFPLSILGGKAEFMDTPDYFLSNTHNGEISAIQEAIKTLRILTPQKILQLWKKGEYVMDQFKNTPIYLKGYNTRAIWCGDETDVAKFWQEMGDRGYHLGKAFFIRHSMSFKDLKIFVKIAKEVIYNINTIKLHKDIPQPIFKR